GFAWQLIGWKKTRSSNTILKFDEVTRVYLPKYEIQRLMDKVFKNDRLSLVRDIFLFSYFTGLACVNTQQLTWQNVSIRLDGNKWIFAKRQKNQDGVSYAM
ncbi:MAG: hypothetical protein ACRC0E_00745, partial [Soonwooa sp.]